jgi:hypothetical protein
MVDVRPIRSTNRPVKRLNEEDAMTVTAMPDAAHGCGWRHRVVAIGSGLGGLTATKALKHDLVNITDVLVFLTRITAQGTAHVHNRTSVLLQVIPTTAAALTVIGVLITLYVAVIRDRQGPPKNIARRPQRQGISVATDVCGIRSGLGKVGANHAINRIA